MTANAMDDALKHPHPEVPFAQVGDDTITALAQLATIFKNKFQTPSAPELIQGPLKAAENKQPASSEQPILTSPHAAQLSNKDTKANKCEHITQHAIISVGGHTNDWPYIISEGADANTKYFPQKLVTRRLERGNFQPGNCIRQKSLDKSTFLPHNSTPSYGQGNGLHGTHERPRPPTSLENFFVEIKNIPKDRQITYGKIVCDYKPHKKGKERVRLTLGGDRLDYSGDVATSTADITTLFFLINSTLSTKDAEMMMMDIKIYYMGTPFPQYEYMHMLLSRFPEEIVNKYNLKVLSVDEWVYTEIRKGMY
jgi:hypothetical protein